MRSELARSSHPTSETRIRTMFSSADEVNPFASPLTDSRPLAIDAGDSDAEMVRREYLNHEASIQGFRSLFVLASVFLAVAAVANLVTAFTIREEGALALGLVIAVFAGLFSALYLWIGLGLRELKPQVKTAATILFAIGLLGFPIGTFINGYGLYLVTSKKGEFVFSKKYAEIRRQTPHIKYKTSIIVWIFVGLLLFVLLLGLVGFMISLVAE